MQGGQNRQPLGYTIVEVLIVLAVSSFMFLIAANFINGKQEHTAFVQGTNEMASRLQGLVEQVTDGHYSDIPLSCAPGTPLDFSGSTVTQGTNQSCVFLGKILHFYRSGTTFPQNYETISLADARSATSANWNVSATGIPNLTTQSVVPQNLEVHRMTIVDASGATNISAYNIGFAQGLGTADALAATDPNAPTYQSGSQTISLIYARVVLNQAGPIGAGNETAVTGSTRVRAAKSATFCLSDGTRSANLSIGGAPNNSNRLSIRVQQLGAVPCP
jgi:hypothetical protein